MSKVIKLSRGLDINLLGQAEKRIETLPLASHYGVTFSDYEGITPKLLVAEGDSVKVGTPLFFDKNRPEIIVTSPVSGAVSAIVRGDKRKLLNIVVATDGKQEQVAFDVPSTQSATKQSVTKALLDSGLWGYIIQRPYGIIATPTQTPKAIFVSGFDSSPLAPDMDFVLDSNKEEIQKGFEMLTKLTEGKVHLSLESEQNGVLSKITDVEQHRFKGKHPVGNVGVQISQIDPIAKGDLIWCVDIAAVAIIGRLFATGKLDMTKTIAMTGSEVSDTHYVSLIAGAPISSIFKKSNIRPQNVGDKVRFISGNVLTGAKRDYETGFLGFYHNVVTAIPEGDKFELLGWAMPRFDKFSVSRTYFSWLMPKRQYTLDTNLNGGERPFVLTGLYEKYMPMDIYPMYLLKAIVAGDIDKMESLGIYEVVEEDLAICEFVDPSKTEMQQIVRQGIELMIKELS